MLTVKPSLIKSTFAIGFIAAACLCCSPAQALTITGTGPGFSIPDITPAGQSSIISITKDITIVDIEISLNSLTHNYSGDLIATLSRSSTGQTVFLFNRISNTSEDSNFGGDYRFSDAFSGNIWSQAATVNENENIPTGDYFASDATGAKVSILGVFGGSSSLGDWVLNISDLESSDIGTLGSWQLSITGTGNPVADVPAPLPLLGAAAAFHCSRRIRRRIRAGV